MGTTWRAITLPDTASDGVRSAASATATPGRRPRQPRDAGLIARRVAARAVDAFTVVFACLALVMLGLAFVMRPLSRAIQPQPWGPAFAPIVLYAIVAFVYEVTFVALRGQTPGKDICRIRVVVAGTDAVPGWARAVRRAVPVHATRLVPGLWLGTAAVLVTAATGARRPIHDHLAGTEVVRTVSDDDAPGERPTVSEEYGPRTVAGAWVTRALNGRLDRVPDGTGDRDR